MWNLRHHATNSRISIYEITRYTGATSSAIPSFYRRSFPKTVYSVKQPKRCDSFRNVPPSLPSGVQFVDTPVVVEKNALALIERNCGRRSQTTIKSADDLDER